MSRIEPRLTALLGVCLFLTGACTKPSSTDEASSSKPIAPGSGTPAASSSPSALAGAVASADGAPSKTVPAKEFCERAAKLGEQNFAQCTAEQRANTTALNYVKNIRDVPRECAIRVESANVEYHADVAYRCLEAAEKLGGKTTFYTFATISACEGVLTGKQGAGKPALYAEECASGLTFVKNRCVEPVAKDGDCDEYPGGILGKSDNGERCQPGFQCFQTGFGADGNPLVFKCLKPQKIGDRCKLDVNQCEPGSSCYQGRCRARAEAGGVCMQWGDCADGLSCSIKGGLFGTCVVAPAVVEKCGKE